MKLDAWKTFFELQTSMKGGDFVFDCVHLL